jgi:hypothetical protein
MFAVSNNDTHEISDFAAPDIKFSAMRDARFPCMEEVIWV